VLAFICLRYSPFKVYFFIYIVQPANKGDILRIKNTQSYIMVGGRYMRELLGESIEIRGQVYILIDDTEFLSNMISVFFDRSRRYV